MGTLEAQRPYCQIASTDGSFLLLTAKAKYFFVVQRRVSDSIGLENFYGLYGICNVKFCDLVAFAFKGSFANFALPK